MTTSLKKFKCLVVDDEEDILEIMQIILSKICDEVLIASSPEEAMRSHHLHHVDLIFSDMSMPGMSGMDFLKAVRSLKIQTPFIFLSGFSDEDRMLEAAKFGASLYLTKPFKPQEILKVAEHYFLSQRPEDERRI